MDSSDLFTHFGALDELIQLIYQGPLRFVLLSKVSDSSWTVHLRLSGQDGRCWCGNWLESDVMKIAGPNVSSKVLETFAQRLADAINQGELSIGNWDPEKGTSINLTLGPTSKKPLMVPLVELTAEEASSHATSVFIALALEAQGRKCQLNPPSVFMSSNVLAPTTRRPGTPEPAKASSSRLDSSPQLEAAKDEIKTLKAQLATSKQTAKRKVSPGSESKDIVPKKVPRPKGASLANPNKKARRYQALEFASDDDN